jgi:hypothetical protein
MTNDDNLPTNDVSTYPTIVDEGELSWYRLWKLKRFLCQPGIVYVLYRYGRQVLVVQPDEQQSIWQLIKTRFTSLAAVDVRPYDLTLEGQLPCHGGAHEFGIIVRLTCCVSDAREILNSNIRDAGARLRRTIFEHIGRVRHEHGVEDVTRVQAAIAAILDDLSIQLPKLEPAFTVTKISVEVQIDDNLRRLLNVELGREYAESVVRKGAVGIAAFQLASNAKDPHAAIKILQDDRRNLVQLRREEEEYLIEHEIVRPQQLEDRALERLSRLEPQISEEPTETVPSLEPERVDTSVMDASIVDASIVDASIVDASIVDSPGVTLDKNLRTETDINGFTARQT